MIDEQDLEKKLVEKITELQDELIKTFDAYRKTSQNFDSMNWNIKKKNSIEPPERIVRNTLKISQIQKIFLKIA